jgi:3-hydroxybutyryl-CoA dehydrogenase
MADVKTIAVIGAGQMGGGIAQISAVAGLSAIVFDAHAPALEKCKALHAKLLARAVEKGTMPQADADAARARLSYTDQWDAIADADWYVEAVVENAAVKKEVFGKLAKLARKPDAVLATNTSSISITEIATAAGDRAPHVVGMHFFYPVPVMKLVEVIRGLQTAPAVVDRTIALSRVMGKEPLSANDRAGFVSNRVLMPMINEAFYALMEGVADAESIDGIMRLGCNFPMGPLRLADFIGLDTCAHIMEVLADGLNADRYRPCPLLKQLVTAGRLGNKTNWGVFDYRGDAGKKG